MRRRAHTVPPIEQGKKPTTCEQKRPRPKTPDHRMAPGADDPRPILPGVAQRHIEIAPKGQADRRFGGLLLGHGIPSPFWAKRIDLSAFPQDRDRCGLGDIIIDAAFLDAFINQGKACDLHPLAWAQGRVSESLIATDPSLMTAAAGR